MWFGLLKVLGISPVAGLIKVTYPSFPHGFIIFLGIWEILIGLFLLNKITLKFGIVLMWIQLAGIFAGALLSPSVYFTSANFLTPNASGEFVIKNFVLLAASYALWKSPSPT